MGSIKLLVHSGATGRKPAASDPRSMTLPAKTGSVCLWGAYPDVDAAMASPIVSAASEERLHETAGFQCCVAFIGGATAGRRILRRVSIRVHGPDIKRHAAGVRNGPGRGLARAGH